MYKRCIKCILDVSGSTLLLVFLSPLLIIIMALIGITMKENPFFVQKRPGKGEKPFGLIKFKTMKTGFDADENLLPDEQRITKLGGFLRKYSLDELPELLNVLTGKMSFVGPRPLLMQYLPYYSAPEKKRHSVRPGITGLAQISGRNMLDWDKRLALDVIYVEHISFAMDATILFKTILYVFTAKDVSVNPDEHEPYLDKIRSNATNH